MKNYHIIIFVALLLVFPFTAMADGLVHGTVTIDDKPVSAEYFITGSEAHLGSGYNACISEYSEGSVEVPATITFNNQTYPVTKVSTVAFRYCTMITEVHLPSNVTRVGDFAFQGCTSLIKVELPSTLTSIGTGAFINLPNFYKIDCHATTPPVWEYNDIFKFHTGGIGDSQTYSYGIQLCVPENSQEVYRNTLYDNPDLGWTTPDGWGNFEYIFMTPDENAEAYTEYNSSNHTLAFYYDGVRAQRTGTTYDLNTWVKDAPAATPAWITAHAADIEAVEFMPSFQFARPVTTVQWFNGCSNLDTIVGWEYLNTEEVKGMGSMFNGCQKLTSEDIDLSYFNTGKVETMPSMFENCQGVTSLDFTFFYTRSCKDMGKMFSNCTNLVSVNLGSFMTDSVVIFDNMFSNCSRLETLDIAAFSINEAAQTTLDGYNGLNNMLMNCSSLTSLIVPSSIRTLEQPVFTGCTSMEDVYYYGPGPFTQWAGCATEFAPGKATRFHVIASTYQDWINEYGSTANVTFVGDLCANGNPLPLYGPADWDLVNELTQAGHSVNAIMMKDIIVNTMVGAWDHPFTGTFDGNGHILNVNYVFTTGDNNGYDHNAAFTGPFRTIRNATIKNLVVGGLISTTGQRTAASGLVGFCRDNGNDNVSNTITNCRVSVLIHGFFTRMSGFIGASLSLSGGTDKVYNTVNGCLFDGRFEYEGDNTLSCAGVITCSGTTTNQIVNHCFEDGSYDGRIDEYSFCGLYTNTSMSHASTNNCYCTTESMVGGTAKRAYSVTIESNDNLNFVFGYGSPEPVAEYNVSGIIAHSPGLELAGISGDSFNIEEVYTYYCGANETVYVNFSEGGLDYVIESLTATNGATVENVSGTDFDAFTVHLASDNTVVNLVTGLNSIRLDAASRLNQKKLHDQVGKTCDVMIDNLTLSKIPAWNPLCLPFDVPRLQGTPLEGATLKVIDSISFENEVIVYHFKDTTAITANKPYLVKVRNIVTNPSFNNVTIKRSLPPGMRIRSDENNYKGFSILGCYNYMTNADINKDLSNYTAVVFEGTSLRIAGPTTTLPGFNVFFEILETPLEDVKALVLDIEDDNNIFIDLDGDVSIDNIFYKNGDWNNAENWAIEVVPDNSQKVLIEGQAVVPDHCVAEANEIVVDNGSITLKDGGQLIHNNEGVVATVEKTINPYVSDKDSYYFIAAPMSNAVSVADQTNLTDNSYDLYYFDQTEELEWINYKPGDGATNPNFNLTNGIGYLYANSGTEDSETFTASFTGTLKPSNEEVSVDLVFDNTATLKGWNLVGNPFACSASLDRAFYVIEGESVAAYTGSTVIAPGTGVMVQAEALNESVTFAKATPESSSTQPDNASLNITLTEANTRCNAMIDNAIVSFNEGNRLGKFYFGKQNANIYIPLDGEEYAIAYSDKQGEMPLSFVTKENGNFTISVNPENIEFRYLHLIDNRTGNDVDLLATSSYTFEAKTTDYESRFKLIFSTICEDTDGDNKTFAFISGGNIIVNGSGTLQVIDILGRQHYAKELSADNCQLTTANFPAGLYVLRLIDGNNVQTQMIVIE